MDQLVPLADRLEEWQQRDVFAAPICLSKLFVGLVESWAAGSDWCACWPPALARARLTKRLRHRSRAQVCEDTSLDEGDVSRLLRRVAEFLGQVRDTLRRIVACLRAC
jgi:superfamily II RNA helicase